MDSVGSFEAKTHFAKLLERAYQGETIVITKHGQAMAKLGPAWPSHRQNIAQVFREMDKLRAELTARHNFGA